MLIIPEIEFEDNYSYLKFNGFPLPIDASSTLW